MSNSVLSNWLGNYFLAYLHTNGGYLGLHEADPTVLGLLDGEVAGGGYQRQRILFGPPSNKTVLSTNPQRFVGMPVCHVLWLATWDSPTGGLLLFKKLLAPAIDVPLNGQFLAATGDVGLTL